MSNTQPDFETLAEQAVAAVDSVTQLDNDSDPEPLYKTPEPEPVQAQVAETPAPAVAPTTPSVPEETPVEPTPVTPAPETTPKKSHFYTAKNTTMDFPVFVPVAGKGENPPDTIVYVPMRFGRLREQIGDISLEDVEGEYSREAITKMGIHFDLIKTGIDSFNTHLDSSVEDRGYFESTLDNENSNWRQDLVVEGFNTASKTFNKDVLKTHQSPNLSPNMTRDAIASLLGQGASHRFLLPHTGIHINVGPASDQEILNLELDLALSQSKVGYDTAGAIFQNSNWGRIQLLVDFILSKVRHVNIKGGAAAVNLEDYIRITDLPILYWGMAYTLYPNGFLLELPCTHDPRECTHVTTVNANINRMAWYNYAGFSPEQLRRVHAVKNEFTPKEVLEYQTLGLSRLTKEVELPVEGGNVKAIFKIPTIREHLDAGREFTEDAANSVRELFLRHTNLNEEQKNDMIKRNIALNTLREYSQYIEKIIINNQMIVSDKDAIKAALEEFSGNHEVVDFLYRELQQFTEESTLAVIAVPNFSCSKCEKDYAENINSKHPELVPINPLRLFFRLTDQRLLRRAPTQTNS